MDLLKKITEDWFNEFNREIRRGKYPETRINIGYFDALDCGTGEVAERSRYYQKADSPTPEARIRQAINDIP